MFVTCLNTFVTDYSLSTGTAVEANGYSFLYLSEQVIPLTHLICHCVQTTLGLSPGL